jgi:hypothetical protein
LETELKIKLVNLECPNWQLDATIDVPSKFAVLFLAQRILEFKDSYKSLVEWLVINGAASLYFWGVDRDCAADLAAFSIAEKKSIYAIREACPTFITASFSADLDESLELILESYLPDVFPEGGETLIIANLPNSSYSGQLVASTSRLNL